MNAAERKHELADRYVDVMAQISCGDLGGYQRSGMLMVDCQDGLVDEGITIWTLRRMLESWGVSQE